MPVAFLACSQTAWVCRFHHLWNNNSNDTLYLTGLTGGSDSNVLEARRILSHRDKVLRQSWRNYYCCYLSLHNQSVLTTQVQVWELHCTVKMCSHPLDLRVVGATAEAGQQGWLGTGWVHGHQARDSYWGHRQSLGKSWIFPEERILGLAVDTWEVKEDHRDVSALLCQFGTPDPRAKLWRLFCSNYDALGTCWGI